MSSTAVSRGRVVVVEDDPTTRQLLADVLMEGGYDVVPCRNGEECMKIVGDQVPDVVLLDLALPERSGLSVLGALKADERTANVPVVVVSAYARMMSERHNDQADAAIVKPFDIDALLAEVNRLTAHAS